MNPNLLRKSGGMGQVVDSSEDEMIMLGKELIDAVKANSPEDVVHCIKAMCLKFEASEGEYQS